MVFHHVHCLRLDSRLQTMIPWYNTIPPTRLYTLCMCKMVFVNLWPCTQTSHKVNPLPICTFPNVMLWALKRCVIWLHSTSWSEVMVVWIFQNVYISMVLAITFCHVSQNRFCRLYKWFVIQDRICQKKDCHYSIWKLTLMALSPQPPKISPYISSNRFSIVPLVRNVTFKTCQVYFEPLYSVYYS